MNKFVVFSGFLGAGKTTTMMALTQYYTAHYGKADILGVDRPIELPHRFENPCTDLAVILNTSAACPDETLDRLIGEAVETVSGRYQLELTIFKKDHFSLGE